MHVHLTYPYLKSQYIVASKKGCIKEIRICLKSAIKEMKVLVNTSKHLLRTKRTNACRADRAFLLKLLMQLQMK